MYENNRISDQWCDDVILEQYLQDQKRASSKWNGRSRKSGASYMPGTWEWYEYWLNRTWMLSVGNGNPYVNVLGYNVAIIQDHNQSDQWRYRIADPHGKQTWSRHKYSRPEEAKRPALEELAKMLNH